MHWKAPAINVTREDAWTHSAGDLSRWQIISVTSTMVPHERTEPGASFDYQQDDWNSSEYRHQPVLANIL